MRWDLHISLWETLSARWICEPQPISGRVAPRPKKLEPGTRTGLGDFEPVRNRVPWYPGYIYFLGPFERPNGLQAGCSTRKLGGYDFISSFSMNHDEDRGPVGLCGIQERYIPTYPGTRVPRLHILFGPVLSGLTGFRRGGNAAGGRT